MNSWPSSSNGEHLDIGENVANKKKKGNKNVILAIVQKEDPHRYRDRVVRPEKGMGRKDRPRNKDYSDFFDCAA